MSLTRFRSYTFFPGQHWSHTWERQHEIITRFANYLKNRQISICSPLGLLNHNPLTIDFLRKVFNYRKAQKMLITQNLTTNNMIMVNKFHVPFHNTIFGKLNFELLKNDMGMTDNNFFWSTYMNPTVYEFFKRSKFRVYDIAERRSTNPNLNEKIKKWEETAVKEADIVIVDNHATLEDYKDLNTNIFYIPQGVNLEEFNIINNEKREYIGYIGNLHFAIDYQYFENLIRKNPGEKFLIIGGILEKEANRLLSYPNVTYIPQIPKHELNQYLAKMKLGLIPYIINDHTSGVYPTKLFEYLAAGVPVLSTALPEVIQYQDKNHLIIRNDPVQLSDLKFQMNDISNMLKSNTWDSRWKEYMDRINSML